MQAYFLGRRVRLFCLGENIGRDGLVIEAEVEEEQRHGFFFLPKENVAKGYGSLLFIPWASLHYATLLPDEETPTDV